MARYASSVISAGKDPYTSWFPYIGLGSAQYLHYQSLGSVLTGLAGVVVGPDTAFRWSIYLLLSLWPFVIYSSARLFGLPRAAAAISAMLSPFIVSFTGVGYERGAYLWIGGAEVWTQLVGSWALPFAWASSWRAMRDTALPLGSRRTDRVDGGSSFHERRPRFPWDHRCGLGGRRTAAGRRLRRAAVLFVASLAAAAWVIVPLLVFTKWSAINQELATTGYVRGYGAAPRGRLVVHGRIFDARHDIPAITVAVLLGVALAIVRWRREPLMRALVALPWRACCSALGRPPGPARGPGPGARRPVLPPLHDGEPTRRDLPGRYSDRGDLARLQLDGCRVSDAAPRRSRCSAVAAGSAACFWPAARTVSQYDQRNAAAISYQRRAKLSRGRPK